MIDDQLFYFFQKFRAGKKLTDENQVSLSIINNEETEKFITFKLDLGETTLNNINAEK